MKISIVDSEKQGMKYITAGNERVVLVEAFSDNDDCQHYFEWKTDARLENVLGAMKKLYSEARYDYDTEDKIIDEESISRGMSVGRKHRETFLFHPQPDFWQYPNPISRLEDEDVCLRMITPHYQIYCLNLSYKEGNKDLPLYTDKNVLKNIRKRPIREGVNRLEVITNFDIGNILAELLTTTSSFFPKSPATKKILTQKFDQILSQYQKPTKLH